MYVFDFEKLKSSIPQLSRTRHEKKVFGADGNSCRSDLYILVWIIIFGGFLPSLRSEHETLER